MVFLLRRSAGLLLLFLLGCTQKTPTDAIQVAHLLPLTGGDKKAAEDARRGMLLAVVEINAEDKRIAGRTVEVRNIDSRGDPEVVQAEAVRLVTLNKVVAFVAGPDSATAERLVRTAQPYSVPVLVPCDLPPDTGLNGYLPLNAFPATRGELLARYVVQELKPKRAVVLTDQRHPVAVALAAAFMQEWPRATPPMIEEWSFRNDTEQIDFASRLAALGSSVALFAGTAADFLKLQAQLQREKALVTLLYGGEDAGGDGLRQPGVETMTATVFAREGLSESGKEFAKRYEERFHEPPSFAAAQAYDAGRLLFDVMQQAKTGTPARVRDDLLRLESFDSVTGKVIWKERKAQRPVFIVRIKDREATLVQTINLNEK